MKRISPLEIEGIEIGHATNAEAATGCTALICRAGATGAVDVRGGAPATRETDLLRPENMVEKINAVVLSGGSAFGLDAASGAMHWLADAGVGFATGGGVVPIVPAACLFDLMCGESVAPDAAMGAAACADAAARAERGDTELPRGNVGAGAGATVGKFGGPTRAMKAGLGVAGFEVDGLKVAAVVAVNAGGSVYEADGSPLAGVLTEDGAGIVGRAESDELFAQACMMMFAAQDAAFGGPVENTTIGCVVTNADLTKAQATKVATMAHDGYARAIAPVHTSNDGDTIFVMATGAKPAPLDLVGYLAALACEEAIRDGVRSAEGCCGLKAACDL